MLRNTAQGACKCVGLAAKVIGLHGIPRPIQALLAHHGRAGRQENLSGHDKFSCTRNELAKRRTIPSPHKTMPQTTAPVSSNTVAP